MYVQCVPYAIFDRICQGIILVDQKVALIGTTDVLSKNSHKFQIIQPNKNICSFAVNFFMMVAIALH